MFPIGIIAISWELNTKTGLELIDCRSSILFSLWKFWTPVSPSYSSILHSKTIRQQNVLSKMSQRFFSGNFKLQQTRGRSCVEVQLPVGFPYPPFSVNFNCFQVLCFPTFKFSSIEWKALLFSISLKRVFQIKFCNFDSTTCSQQTALACLSSLWSINMYFHPYFERYWNWNIFYLSTKEKFLV